MMIEEQSMVVVSMEKKKILFEKIHQDYDWCDFDIFQLILLAEFFVRNKPFAN